ncbi:hypothetical protein [Pelagibius sp.]|uniref:hypothetical protein n=1 Tax=Pelagibius sp. TaxID=1931238 RepID=UPI003BB02E01
MKRIEITGRGLYGKGGKEFALGTQLEVSEVPRGWASRCRVLNDDDGKTLVTNPADTLEGGQEDDDLAALRAEYEEAVGKKPFNGWDADTLREKIAAAKAASE